MFSLFIYYFIIGIYIFGSYILKVNNFSLIFTKKKIKALKNIKVKLKQKLMIYPLNGELHVRLDQYLLGGAYIIKKEIKNYFCL